MKEPSEQEQNPWQWVGLAVAFALILALWALSWGLIWWQPGILEAGQFGDMFGAVNALFSGVAFAGIIVAIFMQRQELRLQRQELELTRRELGRSANAQEQQISALRLTAELNARAALLVYYSGEQDVAAQVFVRNPSGALEQDQKLREILDNMEGLGGVWGPESR